MHNIFVILSRYEGRDVYYLGSHAPTSPEYIDYNYLLVITESTFA